MEGLGTPSPQRTRQARKHWHHLKKCEPFVHRLPGAGVRPVWARLLGLDSESLLNSTHVTASLAFSSLPLFFYTPQGLPMGACGKNPPANAGDMGWILGSGRSLEKEMATHSSILFFFLIFIFTLFYFTILYWFCHTLTWIHHGCTCVPKHEPLQYSCLENMYTKQAIVCLFN